MKFYKWINEGYGESRIDEITESEAKETIRYNCKKSAMGTPIFRGGSNNVNFGFGDPSKSKVLRKSMNTYNYYTLILDNSSPWKNFPKRSLSFICTTAGTDAESYGNIHRVIPFDGTDIGVCPLNDLWLSFKDFNDDFLISFTEVIHRLAEKDSSINTRKLEDNYKYLMKSLDVIGENLREDPAQIRGISIFDQPKEFLEGWLKTNKKFSAYILERFSPKYNNFKLKKAGNNLPGYSEVWFSGKAIFISESEEINILDYYKNLLEWANDIEAFDDKGVMVT